MLDKDIDRILFSQSDIENRVADIAAEINRDYAGKSPLLISVLRGSFIFMADLMRAIDIPVQIDFMAVSSYGQGAQSTGMVRIDKDIDISLAGKHILIAEDILDSGKTLSHLMALLATREPASMRVVALLDKPSRRTVDIRADYTGFEVPDEFLVGYGLDYAERYRNLPGVAVLKREVYAT